MARVGVRYFSSSLPSTPTAVAGEVEGPPSTQFPTELASAMEQRDLRRLYYLLTMPTASAAALRLPEAPAVDAVTYFRRSLEEIRADLSHEGLHTPAHSVSHGAPPVTSKEFGRLLAIQSRAGDVRLVEETFALMLELGLPPTDRMYASRIAVHGADVETALRLYGELKLRGMRRTAAPCTAVLQSFILAGRMDEAFAFYDEQVLGDHEPVEPNTVLFNCLLFGCVRHRDAHRGTYVYEYMREQAGCKPDAATYSAVMLLCGQRFQAERAVNIYEEMQTAGVFPTEFTFNHLIKACASRWDYMERAFGFVEEMKACGFAPNADTYRALLQACSSAGDVKAAQMVLKELAGLEGGASKTAYTMLLSTISRSRSRKTVKDGVEHHENIRMAKTVFSELEREAAKTADALSIAEAQGADEEELQRLQTVAKDAAVDEKLLSAYLSVFTEGNRKNESYGIFREKFAEHGLTPPAAAFSMLMIMHTRKGEADEVFKLYAEMKDKGVQPDSLTYLHLLEACAKDMRINNALQIVKLMNAKNMDITIKHLRMLVIRMQHERMLGPMEELKDLVWHHVPVRRMFLKVPAHPEEKRLPPKPINPGKIKYRMKYQSSLRHKKLQDKALQKKRATNEQQRQRVLKRKLEQ